MADRLNFTTPQQVAPPAASFEMVAIHKRRKPWHVHIELLDDQGRTKDINIDGDLAKQVVKQLNTSNNATKAEDRRVLEWLQNNGPNGPTDPNKYLGGGAFEQVADEVLPPQSRMAAPAGVEEEPGSGPEPESESAAPRRAARKAPARKVRR